MILKNSLYTIIEKSSLTNGVCYDIALDAAHTIYQAHFPGEPITPGVCLVQITQELLENHLQEAFFLKSIRNVKFLSVVSPVEQSRVIFFLEKVELLADSNECKVVAQVKVPNDGKVLAKLSMLFRRR